MGGDSIRNKMMKILFLSGAIPVAIASGLLLYYAHREVIVARDSRKVQTDHLRSAVFESLLRLEVIVDVISSSRELSDALNSPLEIRSPSLNLLYGRIASLGQRAAGISHWCILDRKGVMILSYPEHALCPRQPNLKGQEIFFQKNKISLNRTIRYDDQSLSGPHANLHGFVVATISAKTLFKRMGRRGNIIGIGPKLSRNNLIVKAKQERMINFASKSLAYISILLATLILSLGSSLYFVRKWFIYPLERLTNRVKPNKELSNRESSLNEIALLEESFDQYLKNLANAQKQLIQKSQLEAVGQATQMIAHDMRKPFELLEMLLDSVEAAPTARDLRDLAERSLPRLRACMDDANTLIQDMLDMSSKAPQERVESVDLHQLLKVIVERFQHQSEQQMIHLTFESTLFPSVKANRSHLDRAISNIVGNAIEATPAGGNVWISFQEKQEAVSITIGNTGSYISEEDRSLIFLPFFSMGKGRGRGLGLAIAQQFIAAYNGAIQVISDPNLETRFEITFPQLELGTATHFA